MQYRFVACTPYRFHKVYLDTFKGEISTSIVNAVASVSRAAMCLHPEELGCDRHALSLFNTAEIEGKLEILIWGEDSGYELDTVLKWNIIAHAALNGCLEVVKYLRQLDISWKKDTLANAAMNGQLEFLKWVRANQCPWDENTCASAGAMNGHLELLKWARVNQCPWDEWTCANAAKKNGHLELLKWARSNGCPWDQETYELGIDNGDPALMRYLEDEGCPMYEK